MQPVTLAVRESYAAALQGLVYKNVLIPVFEEFVEESVLNKIKPVMIGNIPIKVFIILLNQTANDNSAKCQRSDQSSIQLQIKTIFPKAMGGSKTAEEVAALVMDKLFNTTPHKTTIVMPTPFNLWKSSLMGSMNIPYRTETGFTFVHQMIFMNWVSQAS